MTEDTSHKVSRALAAISGLAFKFVPAARARGRLVLTNVQWRDGNAVFYITARDENRHYIAHILFDNDGAGHDLSLHYPDKGDWKEMVQDCLAWMQTRTGRPVGSQIAEAIKYI